MSNLPTPRPPLPPPPPPRKGSVVKELLKRRQAKPQKKNKKKKTLIYLRGNKSHFICLFSTEAKHDCTPGWLHIRLLLFSVKVIAQTGKMQFEVHIGTMPANFWPDYISTTNKY